MAQIDANVIFGFCYIDIFIKSSDIFKIMEYIHLIADDYQNKHNILSSEGTLVEILDTIISYNYQGQFGVPTAETKK